MWHGAFSSSLDGAGEGLPTPQPPVPAAPANERTNDDGCGGVQLRRLQRWMPCLVFIPQPAGMQEGVLERACRAGEQHVGSRRPAAARQPRSCAQQRTVEGECIRSGRCRRQTHRNVSSCRGMSPAERWGGGAGRVWRLEPGTQSSAHGQCPSCSTFSGVPGGDPRTLTFEGCRRAGQLCMSHSSLPGPPAGVAVQAVLGMTRGCRARRLGGTSLAGSINCAGLFLSPKLSSLRPRPAHAQLAAGKSQVPP